MIPSDIKWILSYGLLGCMFYLSISPTVTGDSSSLNRLFAKLGAAERQMKKPSYPVSTGSPMVYWKRDNETSNSTTVEPDSDKKPEERTGSNIENTAPTVTAAATNNTYNSTTVHRTAVQHTTAQPKKVQRTKVQRTTVQRTTLQTRSITSIESTDNSTKLPEDNSSSATTLNASLTTEELTETKPKYILPKRTKPPPFIRNVIADVSERDGEDEAIVETRPYLLHPLFTTYMLIVTLPCVVGWCLLTFVCLWICRPNSPLYREILKRLIEHRSSIDWRI